MGHHLRVEVSKVLTKVYADKYGWHSVGDLSCGNGEIARSLLGRRVVLGDFAPGYAITGPLEQTLPAMPAVDGYICSETLEHVDEPALVLRLVRAKTDTLILSTPLEAWDDINTEHYWAWDRAGVESVLASAGWLPEAFASVDSRVFGEPYLYGIWVCR